MNGVHDMGGMHGMGPIEHEKNEPVFHAVWEGRIYALTRVLRAGGGRSNLDASRHAIEVLPPAEYLRMSYYERWVARMLGQIVSTGVATAAEVESGQPAPGSAKATPALTAAMVPEMIAQAELGEAQRRSDCSFQSGPARSRTQHQSTGSHTLAAIRARKGRRRRPASRCLRVP